MAYRKGSELDKEAEITKRARKCYRDASDASGEWREEAEEAYDVIAGHQWDEAQLAKLRDELRPAVTFNVTGKFVDAVSGLQIGNRQEIRYIPRELGEAKPNEMLTGAAEWVRDGCDAEAEETEQFIDLITCGMAWSEMFIDDEDNPEGDIKAERRDPLMMYWDPAAKKRNLKDKRWLLRIKPTTFEEIEERWPDKADEIGERGGNDWGMEYEMDSGLHNADLAEFYLDDQSPSGTRNEIPLVEYQWFEKETRYQVVTGQGVQTVTGRQFRRMRDWAAQNGVPLTAATVRKKIFYRAFLVGDTLLEWGESPYQKGFTYICMTGKRDRNRNSFYGMVRALKDPQLWTNKFFSEILHIINTNAKGGILADRNAFENAAEAEAEWARPDSITWLGATHDDNGKPVVIPKPQSQYPQGLDRLMTFTMQSLPEVSGLNLELMGLANRDQAGVLEQSRKQAGMTMVAWAFESMRQYHQEHGRMLAYYIREFISDGRLIRIKSEKGSQQFIRLLRDQQFYEYDVIVDEAPTSPNQKERVWAMLSQMLQPMLAAGLPIPPDVLEYSPLPASLVEKWRGVIDNPQKQQKQQQAEQLAQQQAISDLRKSQADTENTQAETRKTLAEIQKVLSEIAENRADVGKTEAETAKVAAEAGRTMAGG